MFADKIKDAMCNKRLVVINLTDTQFFVKTGKLLCWFVTP